MSFDDYAAHIYQKHRLYVAIAVLKAKPPDLTSKEYIKQLQSKMADNMDDDDVTICSDDFMIDDDSVTILNDFDEGVACLNNGGIEIFNDKMYDNIRKKSIENIQEHLTQTTYYDSVQSQIDNDVTYYENDISANKAILPISTEKQLNNSSYLNDKEFDTQTQLNKLTDSSYDTQKTILYTVHGFTQNYTHYSPSQNDILIPTKYLYRTNDDRNKLNTNSNSVANELNSDVTNINNITITNLGNIEKDMCKDRHGNEMVSEDKASEIILANQNSIMVSQCIDEVYRENKNDLTKNTLNDNNDRTKANSNESNSDYSQNVYEYFNEIHIIDEENRFRNINEKHSNQNINSKNSFKSTEATIFSEENIDVHNSDSNTTHLNINEIVDTGEHSQNFGPNIDSLQAKTIEIAPFEVIEEESETVEVIPYKVLEEFNKINMFLKRRDRRLSCDGYSTDSGYRSDSQLRSSNRSALPVSGITINQSAHCLFNHLMQCPLVSSTREITSEIAQALGQLIDRLHEEESYPPFLEELLDTVDILLLEVYKGQSSEDSEFLKKDEFIQRILLLNKSIHIQSHSIEKITSILTKFHEKITDSNIIYELTNIDEIENVSYLFHILEILLKEYRKNKDILSQSSQLSQDEEKFLNKSSITDLWRKKWNPNFKENSAGSRENRCVLKNCSEILNKIIVECVNSYSLVAFSALKCFNTMQS